MKKGTIVRTIQISLWSILCLIWLFTAVTILLRATFIQPIESTSNTLLHGVDSNYVVGVILFIIGTYIGLIHAITLPSSSKNDVEKFIMPIIFFSFSFLAIPTCVNYLLIHGIYLFPLALFGKIYLGITFYSFCLLVLLGIYSIGINTSKMHQHIILMGLCIVFIVNLMPVNTTLFPQHYLQWTSTYLFVTILVALTIISLFNMWAIYIKESTQHNLLRAIRLTLIQTGALGFILNPFSYLNYVFILLYLAGIAIGFSRERFSQL